MEELPEGAAWKGRRVEGRKEGRKEKNIQNRGDEI